MKRVLFILLVLFVLIVFVYFRVGIKSWVVSSILRVDIPESVSRSELSVALSKSDINVLGSGANHRSNIREQSTIPSRFNLDVQFYPQAPFANWDMPYQEACEEASVLLAMNYIRDRRVSRAEFDEGLLQIVEFEMSRFGAFEHTNVEETASIITEYFNYSDVQVLDDPSEHDIQREIARGRLVLVPLAGQLLKNPYFTAPGPVYHFLVIKGYTKTHFITHDVGTRRGENYTYPFQSIMENIYDYAEPITDGRRRVLVVGE